MFVKLHEQILNSSIMESDVETRYLWMCLLVLADCEGVVDMTIPAIARRVNLSTAAVEKAMVEFCQPDPHSRTSAEEGRRLIPIRNSFGWQIVNYQHYRELRNEEVRREQVREAQKRYRARNHPSSSVITRNQSEPIAEAEADTEADIKKNDSSYEESGVPPVDNSQPEKETPIKDDPRWQSVVEVAQKFSAARGDGGKFTFAFLGKRAKENFRHFDMMIEFFNIIGNYAKSPESVLWKLWNSKSMNQNYCEKAKVKAHDDLKKLQEQTRVRTF